MFGGVRLKYVQWICESIELAPSFTPLIRLMKFKKLRKSFFLARILDVIILLIINNIIYGKLHYSKR